MVTPIGDDQLVAQVTGLLEAFYDKRVRKLQELQLREVLKAKNPYLYRAIGTDDASGIVKNLLDAKISSSDETLFGNDFFEPLAVWISQTAHQSDPDVSAEYASGSGGDLQVVTKTRYSFYAIKSGTAVFNGPSKKRQRQEFDEARSRLSKVQKQFDAVIAYAYGRKNSRAIGYREIAGQSFWAEISGDETMYLRIVEAMGTGAQERASIFAREYDRAANRFTREILANFAAADGSLDWAALTAYNSSSDRPRLVWKTEFAGSTSPNPDASDPNV